MTCPDPETLARFADGLLSDDSRGALQTHLDGCSACREVLVTLARSSRPAAGVTPGGSDIPPRGSAIGRYVVLEPRGAGGMGVVLAAYDDKLDRKVAIKLLRPDLEGGPETARSKARLLREAQLMARVRHPNVVTVFDVGEVGEQIFIAMELVEGRTLRDWLDEHPKASWQQIVELFVRAGRGLVAAHAAGVVHRDFKPDNVLLDEAGQVHVSDFGLAWSAALPHSPAPHPGADATTGLTRESAVLGTPAYMAPEQLRGEPIDARTDQFAFCVALFEALHGERPFTGRDPVALLNAITSGQRALEKRTLPRQVTEALRQGLAADPAARHPDLESLLRVLEGSRRRRWPLVAAGAAAVLAIGAAVALQPVPCLGAPERLRGVWDEARRVAVRSSFDATGLAAAPASWKTVEAAFDGYAGAWSSAWRQTCEATRVQHTQSEEVMTRKMVCLDGRLSELAALTELFSRADPAVVANAGLAVERLQTLEPCSEGELLTLAALPADKQLRALIASARLEVARANALRKAGKHADALTAANAAITQAKASHYRPVEAEALLALADEQRATEKFKNAEASLGEAELAAEAGRDFETLARICIAHILVVGTHSMRPEAAEVWVKRAEGALEQMPRPALRAELDLALSVLRLAQGHPAASEAAARRARDYFAPRKLTARTDDATGMLAEALATQGKFEMAITEGTAALDGRTAFLGATHPLTLRSRSTLAQLQLKSGQPKVARLTLEAISEPVLAALTPITRATALCLRGRTRAAAGETSAVADLDTCVELVKKVFGDQHPYSGAAHDAKASGLRDLGQLDQARAEHELAMAGFGAARSVEAAAASASYAVTLAQAGAWEPAATRAGFALEVFQQADPEVWVDRCPAQWARAEAERRLKSPPALTEARDALSCLAGRPHQEFETARASLTLGLALAAQHDFDALPLLKVAVTPPLLRISDRLDALDAMVTLLDRNAPESCAAAREAAVLDAHHRIPAACR